MREAGPLLLLVGLAVAGAGLTLGAVWDRLEAAGAVPGAMAAEVSDEPPRVLPGVSRPLPVPPGVGPVLSASAAGPQAAVDRPAPGGEGGSSAHFAALVNGALAVAAIAALALIQAKRRGPLR